MEQLELQEEDIDETFYAGRGKGGQKRSKTAAGVVLVHKQSGVRIRCQRERSQSINRFLARRMLVEELEAKKQGKTRHKVKAEKLREAKIRKNNQRNGSAVKKASTSVGYDTKRKKKTLADLENAFLIKSMDPVNPTNA